MEQNHPTSSHTVRQSEPVRGISALETTTHPQNQFVPLPPTETGEYRLDLKHPPLHRPKFTQQQPQFLHTEIYLG